MTRDELIALAKEAGFVPNYGIAPLPMIDYATYGIDPTLERFAQLVAEKKDARIAELEASVEQWKCNSRENKMIAESSERKLAVAREALQQTIEENGHLADGDVCTLKSLKDALAQIGGKKEAERKNEYDAGLGTTPGMWEMLSDALAEYEEKLPESLNDAIYALRDGKAFVVIAQIGGDDAG